MRFTAVVLLGFIAALCAWRAEAGENKTLEERVADLEKWKAQAEARFAALEGAKPEAPAPAPAGRPAPSPSNRGRSVIEATLSNKRYDDGGWNGSVIVEKGVWWDATYKATGLTKPTRAVRGVLVFADLFGEAKFRLRVTITDSIRPGGTLSSKGDGFHYSHYDDDHRWMRLTELKDMKVAFEVKAIIYTDGTTEEFGD